MLQHKGLLACAVACAGASKYVFRPLMEIAAKVSSETAYSDLLTAVKTEDISGQSSVFRIEIVLPKLVEEAVGSPVRRILEGLPVNVTHQQKLAFHTVKEETLADLPLLKVRVQFFL